ncbi:MAG: AAA family ATPase [Promethearchaeota archaeon]
MLKHTRSIIRKSLKDSSQNRNEYSMRIKKIVLENYRQFKGHQELEFKNNNEGKNITLIIGENGEGKTNFLNSISWCLYGKERKTTDYDELPIPTQILDNETSNELKQVLVEISFDLADSNKKYDELIITRESTIYNGDIDGQKLTAVLIPKNNPNPVSLTDPNIFIGQNIPEDLIDFFLFDGEQLENYFLSTVSDTVAKGIEKLARIDILKETIRKLKEVKKDYAKEVAKHNPNLEYLLKERDMLESKKTTTQSQIMENKRALTLAESEKNKIDREYETCKGQDIQKLANERQELETQRKTLNKNRSSLEEERLKYTQYEGPFFLSNSALKKVRELIDNKEKIGEFPPDIKDTFVKQLLEQGLCICKQELTEGSIHRKEVEFLLKTLITQEFIQIAQTKYKEILVQQTKYKNLSIRLKRLRSEISAIQNQINLNTLRSKQISEILKDNPEEFVKALETQRKSLEKRIYDLTRSIGRLEHSIDQFKSNEIEVDTKINNELNKQKKHKLSVKRRDLTNAAIEILEKAKINIESETMMKVNKKMNDYFREFHWKDENTFDTISLETESGLSIKKFGKEALGSLSAGEQNFLALAFITAVRDVSGFDLPVIIDTPFGRIGEAARRNISQNLPKYLKNSQITILATPSEYTGAVKKGLDRFINKIINLKYDKISGTTEIS